MTQSTEHGANPGLPLDGVLVVDLSQFLAGPMASLKLADMGARVIKVERPGQGDLARQLYLSDTDVGGTNTLFQAINRNKESYTADLKSPVDVGKVQKLIERADVVIQSFRPGVIERLGLDYASVKELNPRIVYASVSGYGSAKAWERLPGQDLLAQARSGLMWLTGDAEHPPTPMGLAVADMMTGHAALEGILAGLVRSLKSGQGALVEVSLLESVLDMQFEVLTTWLNDGQKPPARSKISGGHAYLAAPYGVYRTKDGFVAVAMTPVERLAELLHCPELAGYTDRKRCFTERDTIKAILAERLRTETTAHWMKIFNAADTWASEVLDWPALMETEAFRQLDFIQGLDTGTGKPLRATRCPIRLDGKVIKSSVPAPTVGQHTDAIEAEFLLNAS